MKQISAYYHPSQVAQETPDLWVNNLPGNAWRQHPCYYVSARDGEKYWLLLGPFRGHVDALVQVSVVKKISHDADPRSYFYSFGTCRAKTGEKEGSANKIIGHDIQVEGRRT